MSIIRIKFKKNEQVKFISHLDMMKAFQRAIARAGIRAEYSQGFNPQMLMVFGAPLSLGFTSEAEYADISLAEDIAPELMMEKLGKELPPGLPILGAGIRTIKTNIMADISYAEYRFEITGTDEPEKLGILTMGLEAIEVEKTRKGKSKNVDIRPLVIDFTVEDKSGILLVKAGNSGNLNPRLLAVALSGIKDESIEFRGICRTRQYIERNGTIYDPISQEALVTE